MNMYTKLSMHLSRYMYKRGRNKGDAPANRYRRGMSHFRVVKGNDDTLRIRMWSTDIITAYPNGDVKIDTNGYHSHNTTIIRLNEAFDFFDGSSVGIGKQSVLSYSQPVLRVNGKRYYFYDGITLNAQGEVITPLQAFEQKRVDKAATKELAEDLVNSGFKDTFPLLYATTTVEDRGENDYSLFGVDWTDVLSNNDQADKWKTIIARNKFERSYSWSNGGHGYDYTEKSNAKGCWATIMQYCKKNMYIVSRSETYVL
jgi:hypothetical protein